MALLLNNSEVRHLTLIHCGPGGAGAPPPASLGGYFAVQHLERLTVVSMQQQVYSPDATRYSNTDPGRDNRAHIDSNRYSRDTNLELNANMKSDSSGSSSPNIQDILLGRELGAAYHEQARLGIIHGSVLEWGAEIKAYTVQTHIDSEGALPFPDLHLSKLPETSVIYVSFVY